MQKGKKRYQKKGCEEGRETKDKQIDKWQVHTGSFSLPGDLSSVRHDPYMIEGFFL